jgi:hypothetical protein
MKLSMQEKLLFEYAVLRAVPRVEREEFMNIGVILYCSKEKFLRSIFDIDQVKLAAFCAECDVEELTAHAHAVQSICNGSPASGPIGKLDLPSRFRWLTATRSTVLQASKVHPGFCAEPGEMLIRLQAELVL